MLRTACVLISIATTRTTYLERDENAMTLPIMAHSIFALLFFVVPGFVMSH